MTSKITGLRVAGAIFAFLALVHVWRVLADVPVQLGTSSVPQSASIVAIIIAGLLSVWMWKLASDRR